MPLEPQETACARNVEKLDRAYREANRLVVAAGLVLAGVGVGRGAPEMKALSAALRAVNHGRGQVHTPSSQESKKEFDRAHPPVFGRRFRRAVP